MKYKNYIELFKKIETSIDKKILKNKKIESAVGLVLESAYLKLYKKSWTNNSENPLNEETRIFFSIWINEITLKENKIYYNIHALKLRKSKNYTIESRKFANLFREDFESYKNKWKNVSVDFGPLTLMQGWIPLNNETIKEDVLELTNNFLELDHLIDKTLSKFKKN